ncbi:MAG: aminopeptidase P family protein [Acidobacteria bacterium]|nr:aminopeptidase P family protein [Acidobacteriota bacterium]
MKSITIRLLTFVLIAGLVFVTATPFEGAKNDVFKDRRLRLMLTMERDGIAVFRTQGFNPDFYYLTGVDSGPAALVLLPGESSKSILFLQPQRPAQITWVGKQPTLEEAAVLFGVDEVFPVTELEFRLGRFLQGRKRIYCDLSDDSLSELVLRRIKRPFGDRPQILVNPQPQIHAMRLVKDAVEIAETRESCRITCEALKEVMRTAEPGMYEYELESVIEFVFRKSGARGPGFPSIVGSGPRSTYLHYEANTHRTKDGDLVVMDVGAMVDRYTADVTRTMPVSGVFTPEQRDIYDAVLKSQIAAVAAIRPGRGLDEIHQTAVEILKDELFRLGLMTDKDSDWQLSVWLMYNTNHWIGLDVHDVGGRGPDDGVGILLEPGMILTVEPGIYIGEHILPNLAAIMGHRVKKEEIQAFIDGVRPSVQKYLNIGVRIEDDVLVTETGGDNLSAAAPRTVEDIEALMKEKSRILR